MTPDFAFLIPFTYTLGSEVVIGYSLAVSGPAVIGWTFGYFLVVVLYLAAVRFEMWGLLFVLLISLPVPVVMLTPLGPYWLMLALVLLVIGSYFRVWDRIFSNRRP